MKPSRVDFLDCRGRRLALRRWGPAGAPPLVLLHGWMDVSASFQFLVDALAREWSVLAPDWRGCGLSQGNGGATYWFADYLGDLDALLAHHFPGQAVPLVGHSMGGNVACLYAGLRPGRVSQLISLEGFGIGDMAPELAPERLQAWLDSLPQAPRLHRYPDRAALAARLCRDNPRLPVSRAAFLAEHLGQDVADGGVVWAADARHKTAGPLLYRLEEAKACWRRVQAPTLWVRGGETSFLERFQISEEDYRARLACFADGAEALLPEAGHMLHHDCPESLAALVESFLPA